MSNSPIEISAAMPSGAFTAQGAAAGVVSLAIPASQDSARCLTSVLVSYSGAASGNVTLTISNGATPVWAADISVALAAPQTFTFPGGGISGSVGSALTVALTAGAASSVGRISATAYSL